MFTFNNTHIFTGYLKQLLSSFNLPTCKIYTAEFARYYEENFTEDPRIIESFDQIPLPIQTSSSATNGLSARVASRTNYMKNGNICNLFFNQKTNASYWQVNRPIFYDKDVNTPGLTRVLNSPGANYDVKTHEYLGDFLRFLRDYYNVNLMSLYNCFTNKLYSNIYIKSAISSANLLEVTFDSNDPKYKIYALPVKLFADYTIAIECSQGIELFCGIYKTVLDTSDRAKDLFTRTYQKVNATHFSQPFIYDKLNVRYWPVESTETLLDKQTIARCDIAAREQDLKLFIKVPASCRSSIAILEGDYRNFNDCVYIPHKNYDNDVLNAILKQDTWKYTANHSIINFESKANLNKANIKLVSKVQLLALNTNESYPFADRLVEYLCGSAISPIDGISDNIARVQKVMNMNKHFFTVNGVWENQIQKIMYDYIMNSGPVSVQALTVALSTDDDTTDTKVNPNVKLVQADGDNTAYYTFTLNEDASHSKKFMIKQCGNTFNKKIILDAKRGIHPKVGHYNKSFLYDILGYIDSDAEKYYANYRIEEYKDKDGTTADKISIQDTLKTVDIYNGLFDI